MKFFILLLSIGACGQPSGKQTEQTAKAPADGQAIYREYCVICHGADGKLGLNGAGDLTKSTLPRAQRILQITKGKGLMTPFEGTLTPEEIEAVADYSLTLKEQ